MTKGSYGGGTYGIPWLGGLGGGLYIDSHGRIYPQVYYGTPGAGLSAGYTDDLEGLLTGTSISGGPGAGTFRPNGGFSGSASGVGIGTPGVGVTYGFGPLEMSQDFSHPWAFDFLLGRENTPAEPQGSAAPQTFAPPIFAAPQDGAPVQLRSQYAPPIFAQPSAVNQPFGELSVPHYSPSQRLGHAAQDALMWMGAQPSTARHLADGLGGILGLTPAAVPVAAADLIDAKSRGDIGGAVQAMAGMIPAARGAKEGAKLASALELRASRNPMMYNPPSKPPRAFVEDYPNGGLSGPAGTLQADIEGRPLGAQLVAGRRSVGGDDVALSPAEINSAAAGLTGSLPRSFKAREAPRGAVGIYGERRGPDGPQRSVGYLANLNETQRPRVIAHEVGHAIDEMSGQIPTDGLNTELRQAYNTLYSGQERTRNLTGPQHLGYGSADVPRELMAEAIRGYMVNPNWLKTVAPKTAARIREFVNNNPRVKDVIQFNTIAPIAIGTASALDADARVHVRDSAAMAGVPSRYNVFEYGFPDLQNTSAGDQNLRATATNNAGPATGSASDSRVTSVFDTGSARIPYPYAGGLSGPFASASRSELSQDQPSAGGLLGLIQDYMRATQGERSGR